MPVPTGDDSIIIPEEQQTGFIFPRQSNLVNFMIYETVDEAEGALTNLETGEFSAEAEVLTDGNLLRLKVNIAPWLTVMLDDSSSSIISPFADMEILVSDFDGTSQIIFTPNSE